MYRLEVHAASKHFDRRWMDVLDGGLAVWLQSKVNRRRGRRWTAKESIYGHVRQQSDCQSGTALSVAPVFPLKKMTHERCMQGATPSDRPSALRTTHAHLQFYSGRVREKLCCPHPLSAKRTNTEGQRTPKIASNRVTKSLQKSFSKKVPGSRAGLYGPARERRRGDDATKMRPTPTKNEPVHTLLFSVLR